jgi:protein-disulfide isomerase
VEYYGGVDDQSSAMQKQFGIPVAIVLAGAIVAAALYFRPAAPGGGAPVAEVSPAPTVGQVAGAKVDVAIEEDDIILGSERAPVTVVEFTDFECPFCKRHHETTFKQINEQYIKTGKVRYVVKHFPLPQLHARAEAAAAAAQCANEQGKAADYIDLLFANQKELTDSHLIAYAQQVGMDEVVFKQCIGEEETREAVGADQQAGIAAGVTGTPGFVINGRTLDGAQPFAQFQAAIEEELK